MFDSFRDSARIAQAKKDTEGVTVKRAFVALLAASVVFMVQLRVSDASAVSRFVYAVVTWLVTYFGWPLAEFGWNYLRAPLRIAEGQVMQLQDEKNQLATSVAELNRRVFYLESRLAQRHANQEMADWLTERHGYGVHELLNKKPNSDAELQEWLTKENAFTAGVVSGIESRGGTPQDVHHVHTLGLIPMYNLHPNPVVNHQLCMLVERLNRIANVSTQYAKVGLQPSLSTGVGESH